MRSERLKTASSVLLLSMVALLAAWADDGPEDPADGAPRPEVPDRVPRIDTPIEIDGMLDEPAWDQALRLELPYEVYPGENINARVRTEALLAYDDNKVYAGFIAHDPEPSKIRARLSDRDRAFQDDFVGLVFDTFNDERRAFEFFVNALGVQMDLIQDDVSGSEDESWDAIWESAGHVNDDGYVVEMAIPYTSLRFQRGAGDQVWGLDLIRIYPREQRYQMASSERDRDISCYLCQVSKIVGFEGATPGKNLELVPTVIAGRVETNEDGSPDGSLESTEDAELGATARWGFTPNMTLSGAVNPDFSQVEADAARLTVNEPFALFFADKRPFFLEGIDFFETAINAVHTRTVVDPDWGAKVTGKEGKNAIGSFVARDDPIDPQLLIPGNRGSTFVSIEGPFNDGVFRYRRDVGKSSALGALVTAREGDDYHNRVAGVDALLRPTDADTIRFQLLGSQTLYPDSIVDELMEPDPRLLQRGIAPQPSGEFDDRALSFRYTHRKRDYGIHTSYEDFGKDFRSDLGFVPRVDFRMAVAGGWYTWWQEPDSKWAWFEVGGDWDQTEEQNGDLIEREAEVRFLASGPKQSFIFVGPGYRKRVFNRVEFDQPFVNTFFEMNPTKDLYFNFGFNSGDREDFDFFDTDLPFDGGARQGDEIRASTNIRYNFGRHVRADLFHNYRTLEIDEGRLFRANLSELRLIYQFNVRAFVRAIVQHQDQSQNLDLYPHCDPQFVTNPVPGIPPCTLQPEFRDLFGQFLFAYKLNPQTALYVGYSEDQVATEGTSLTSTERLVFLKIGYAWVM